MYNVHMFAHIYFVLLDERIEEQPVKDEGAGDNIISNWSVRNCGVLLASSSFSSAFQRATLWTIFMRG